MGSAGWVGSLVGIGLAGKGKIGARAGIAMTRAGRTLFRGVHFVSVCPEVSRRKG